MRETTLSELISSYDLEYLRVKSNWCIPLSLLVKVSNWISDLKIFESHFFTSLIDMIACNSQIDLNLARHIEKIFVNSIMKLNTCICRSDRKYSNGNVLWAHYKLTVLLSQHFSTQFYNIQVIRRVDLIIKRCTEFLFFISTMHFRL